jgi:DNA-binding transcriptional MerR regulator
MRGHQVPSGRRDRRPAVTGGRAQLKGKVMEKISISQRLMLTIDQISQLTGVRKSTLRYWEKTFDDFLKPARTHSNRREYTLEDLDRVKAIKNLLEREHLTAYGVRMRLKETFAAPRGEGVVRRKAKAKNVERSPAPSMAGKDSSIQ